jgi:hypothetical protein
LNLPEFREILEREEKVFYTSLNDKLAIVKQIWAGHSDIKDFLKASLDGILKA